MLSTISKGLMRGLRAPKVQISSFSTGPADLGPLLKLPGAQRTARRRAAVKVIRSSSNLVVIAIAMIIATALAIAIVIAIAMVIVTVLLVRLQVVLHHVLGRERPCAHDRARAGVCGSCERSSFSYAPLTPMLRPHS